MSLFLLHEAHMLNFVSDSISKENFGGSSGPHIILSSSKTRSTLPMDVFFKRGRTWAAFVLNNKVPKFCPFWGKVV
jgi:hypothetical protein